MKEELVEAYNFVRHIDYKYVIVTNSVRIAVVFLVIVKLLLLHWIRSRIDKLLNNWQNLKYVSWVTEIERDPLNLMTQDIVSEGHFRLIFM